MPGLRDLYPGLNAKAAALRFSLIQNSPSVDNNKRIGHAAMETTLVLNGVGLTATIDTAEAVVLAVFKLLFAISRTALASKATVPACDADLLTPLMPNENFDA